GNGNGFEAVGGDGGGIDNHGTARLTNVTLDSNAAGLGAFRGSPGTGAQLAGGGRTEVQNVIVAGAIYNCSDGAFIVSLGHNLDDGTSCNFAAAGDRVNADAALGALQDNGGFTQTIGLLPGSQAIDAGDAAACPASDQRGVMRPQGGACDIGAYERQA